MMVRYYYHSFLICRFILVVMSIVSVLCSGCATEKGMNNTFEMVGL